MYVSSDEMGMVISKEMLRIMAEANETMEAGNCTHEHAEYLSGMIDMAAGVMEYFNRISEPGNSETGDEF